MTAWTEGEEVARGATAVVRRGRPGTVVKTFEPSIPAMVAGLEDRSTRIAMAAGLPVAPLLESDLAAEPPTLTFAYVEGEHLDERAGIIGPAGVGAALADLHDLIHRCDPADAVRVEDFLGHQIRAVDLPERVRAAVLGELDRLAASEVRVLCHMDLHPHNVLWAAGPVIIDWTDGMAAPRTADVARTRLLLASEVHYDPPETPQELAATLAGYETRIEELSPGIVHRSRAWDAVVAAARLDERPPASERAELLARLGVTA
ncbi:aminoglycoside phosphotransferase family protein [Demequina sp. NBRC 110053]|uniref:aminoglycoside phosphotransferase family protein n=1 Tax=Demequina sp. NBRC 110053 TaxID=1570342 RepID=UPI0013565B9E|nr:aminoglycoside phosphotransferase family protein [Demequina sp. NBRC 110053]